MVWEKLRKMGVDEETIDAAKSLYEQSRAAVRVNGKLSQEFSIGRGLRQGCPLSPLLFAIALNDVLEELRKEDVGFPWMGAKLQTLAYADNMALIGMSEDELNRLIEVLERGMKTLDLKISIDKTKYMYISKTGTAKDVQVNGKQVEKVASFKYLGSIITDDGGCVEEINNRISKAAAVVGAMNRWLGKDNQLSTTTKMKIYNAVVVPILIYGAETWAMTDEAEMLSVFEM